MTDAFASLFDAARGDAFSLLRGGFRPPSPPPSPGLKSIVVHANSYGIGGLERVVREQCAMFLGMGLEVHLALSVPPGEGAYSVPEGVRVHVLPAPDADYRASVMRRAEGLCRIVSGARAGLYLDSAYQNLFFRRSFELWDWIALKTALGTRVVLHWHSVFSRFLRMPGGERFADAAFGMAGLCDGLIALSRIDAAFFSALGFRCWFLPNPVDPQLAARARRTSRGGAPTVLWCGRLAEVKRPVDALRTLLAVRRLSPGVRLLMVGGGGMMDELRSFVRENGLDGSVEFAGERNDVYGYFGEADAMLSTSDCEGYPMTFVEAMAFGLPTVSFGKGYLEVARGNPAVVSVPAGDYDAAARALVDVLPGGRRRGEACAAADAAWGSLKGFDLAKAYGQMFSEVCGGARPTAGGGVRPDMELVAEEVVRAFSAGESERMEALRRGLAAASLRRYLPLVRRWERLLSWLAVGKARARHGECAVRCGRLVRFLKGAECDFT